MCIGSGKGLLGTTDLRGRSEPIKACGQTVEVRKKKEEAAPEGRLFLERVERHFLSLLDRSRTWIKPAGT